MKFKLTMFLLAISFVLANIYVHVYGSCFVDVCINNETSICKAP